MQIDGAKDLTVNEISQPVDLSFISRMKTLVINCEKNYIDYDYAAALMETENVFWDFCDNYVEIVKARAYQQRGETSGRSAMATLQWTHQTFLRLLAPVMPYITEEVWSWGYAQNGVSIHRAAWPNVSEIENVKNSDIIIYEKAKSGLNKVRGEKTIKQKSLKWKEEKVSISASPAALELIHLVESDLKLAGNLRERAFEFSKNVSANDLEIVVTLADTAE